MQKLQTVKLKPNTEQFVHGQPAIHTFRQQMCNLLAGRSDLPDPGNSLRCRPVAEFEDSHFKGGFLVLPMRDETA
jgi:hypothetical protein